MAVKITSGELRHKVVFKQPVSSLNDRRELEITSYTNQITTWAKVEAFNVRRTTEANATNLIGSLDFYVRYSIANDAIAKDWLIEYKAEDYTIHEIEHVGQEQKFIRFTAKARTNG